MTHWQDKHALVVGGSAGLGLHIARALQAAGANVAIAARNESRLQAAARGLSASGRQEVAAWPVDICDADSIADLSDRLKREWAGLDLLVNSAGKSDRGRLADTSAESFQELFQLNLIGPARCTQIFLPALLASQGSVVNIGSLASKSASPNMGAYPTSKFPIAAYSQQLRLEYFGRLHVLLVCPGPIHREDRAPRYSAENVPERSLQPGGGVRLKGIDPERLSQKILRACERKQLELVVPGRARLLFAISNLFPRLGDWIVRKMIG